MIVWLLFLKGSLLAEWGPFFNDKEKGQEVKDLGKRGIRGQGLGISDPGKTGVRDQGLGITEKQGLGIRG